MCCYNGERFIHRSVGSILAQTYPHIELVFIDDGSTDNSLELIRTYIPKFESKGYKLTIVHQENQGQGFAAITGIEMATGEFLSYLDVDDYLMPESVAKRVNALMKCRNANVVRTNAYRVLESDSENCRILVRSNKEKYPTDIFEGVLMGEINNYAGTYMVRANVIHEFYTDRAIPRSKYGQNLQLLLPCAYKSASVFIDEPLMKYIIQNDSHSNPKSLSAKIDLIQGYMDLRFEMLNLFDCQDKKRLIKNIGISCKKNVLNMILSYHENDDEKAEKISLFNRYYEKLRLEKSVNIELRYYNAYLNNLSSRNLYRIVWLLSRIVAKKKNK